MKKLIAPSYVASFVLICTGLIPGVGWHMAVAGIAAMVISSIVGIQVLGAQDNDFDKLVSRIDLLRSEALFKISQSEKVVQDASTKISDSHGRVVNAEQRVSSAIAEMRSDRSLR